MITVASPDKISLSMYTDFLMKNIGGGYQVGYSHYLMTVESVGLYLDEFSKIDKGILRYYANKKLKDPAGAIPSRLIEASSSVVWFHLYSTDAIIVKDEGGLIAVLGDLWKAHLVKIGGV